MAREAVIARSSARPPSFMSSSNGWPATRPTPSATHQRGCRTGCSHAPRHHGRRSPGCLGGAAVERVGGGGARGATARRRAKGVAAGLNGCAAPSAVPAPSNGLAPSNGFAPASAAAALVRASGAPPFASTAPPNGLPTAAPFVVATPPQPPPAAPPPPPPPSPAAAYGNRPRQAGWPMPRARGWCRRAARRAARPRLRGAVGEPADAGQAERPLAVQLEHGRALGARASAKRKLGDGHRARRALGAGRPQWRQWCRRLALEKAAEHSWHASDVASGSHGSGCAMREHRRAQRRWRRRAREARRAAACARARSCRRGSAGERPRRGAGRGPGPRAARCSGVKPPLSCAATRASAAGEAAAERTGRAAGRQRAAAGGSGRQRRQWAARACRLSVAVLHERAEGGERLAAAAARAQCVQRRVAVQKSSVLLGAALGRHAAVAEQRRRHAGHRAVRRGPAVGVLVVDPAAAASSNRALAGSRLAARCSGSGWAPSPLAVTAAPRSRSSSTSAASPRRHARCSRVPPWPPPWPPPPWPPPWPPWLLSAVVKPQRRRRRRR